MKQLLKQVLFAAVCFTAGVLFSGFYRAPAKRVSPVQANLAQLRAELAECKTKMAPTPTRLQGFVGRANFLECLQRVQLTQQALGTNLGPSSQTVTLAIDRARDLESDARSYEDRLVEGSINGNNGAWSFLRQRFDDTNLSLSQAIRSLDQQLPQNP